MKRKRGKKKGKPKKKPSVVATSEANPPISNVSTEDDSGMDGFEKDDVDSGMDAETPMETDQPEKLSAIKTGNPVDKTSGTLVYARVKVKIKSSKALASQHNSPEVPLQSDTDKSSQQLGSEKQVVTGEKMEDSANSLPEFSQGLSVNKSKKAGSIKIKSSRSLSSSSLSPCYNAGTMQGERSLQKEPGFRRDVKYSKQELEAALDVIKKVMKMDAAEPFNVPVNPIALGIPDYFDVIDTPMDFGTICSNLENGVKYMNSEDVYKDVQYIWDNCFRYNNKGDYIVELMKRVKKNFAKHWTAAGLFEPPLGNSIDAENIHVKAVTPSIHGKMSVKSGQVKHKTAKRHKVRTHKDDCLCAICVMMRRRQEREEIAQLAEDQIESSNDFTEAKEEGAAAVESPSGENSASLDDSQDQDGDADMGDRRLDVKLENSELPSSFKEKQEEKEDKEEIGDRSIEEHHRHLHSQSESDDDARIDTQEDTSREVDNAAVEHHKPKESRLDEDQKAKIYETLRRFENPMVLELCGTLFADNRKSICGGPHSLVRRQGSSRFSSSIHEALATLMK